MTDPRTLAALDRIADAVERIAVGLEASRAVVNLAVAARFALEVLPAPEDEPNQDFAAGIGALQGALDRYDRTALGLVDD